MGKPNRVAVSRHRRLSADTRAIDRVVLILGLAALILAFIFLLVDIAYLIPIVAILGGVLLAYAARGNWPVALLGGIVAVLGLVDGILISVGGGLHL